MSPLKNLFFITGSLPKFEEAKQIIPSIQRIDLDLPEIQELDQKQIITSKLNKAREHGIDNIVVEDTGLYIQALNWKLPGPFIKWFLKSLSLHEIVQFSKDKPAAYAQTDIGYWSKELSEPIFFEGRVDGTIVETRGKGFGWDVIFQVNGTNKTFGEMSTEQKNQVSHRSVAFKKLRDFLNRADA